MRVTTEEEAEVNVRIEKGENVGRRKRVRLKRRGK